ncbi:MAG: M14 family zinc carboxypeptidase [Planctomycetota bacterium]
MQLAQRRLVILSVCLAFMTLAAPLNAQTGTPALKRGDKHWLLPVPELDADPSIPTSADVLRYSWGDDVSSYWQIRTYLRALAESAPGLTKLVEYGKTYEGRSLYYLVISSEENIAKLEEIRIANQRLCDPSCSESEAGELIEKNPAVVWLAYAAHGNEISPSDAALVTAYHLLSDRREVTRQVLEDLVVIIDPLQNPDGRDRFVNVYRETRGIFQQSYARANEHTERWPSGRSNHYWFDMNRDWFRQSQQEVKAKAAAYLRWQPQMYVDAHEMGANSTYYFPPATDPKNPYLMPAQLEWFGKLGKHQAGWFDRYGFGYMTREVFDAFYPGYGSEWPTLQGGLGILWEQASARGAVIDRNDETQLTYHDGVRNHYISGLATLEFAGANREALLKQFRRAKMSAVQEGREGPVQHYFLMADRPERSRRLAEMLERNGIQVDRLMEGVSSNVTDVLTGKEVTRTIPAGSYHVSVGQPNSRLIRALLQRSVEMDEKFLRRQLERNQLRLPDEIYDVTAWSMPLAFDVRCYSAGKLDSLIVEPLKADEEGTDTKPLEAKVAYLIPGSDAALRMAATLIQNDIRLHVADQPFTLGGRKYGRGTLIAKCAENNSYLGSTLSESCAKFGAITIPTDTAYVESGAHMGGPDVRWIKPPKVLMVVHQPTNYSSGHTWHLFDQRLQYPTTRVKGQDFAAVDLSQFDTLVLPDGSYTAKNGFGEETAKRLSRWIRNGGTLVTLRGATRWATSPEVGLIKNRIVKREVPVVEKSTEKESDSESKTVKVTPDNVPGAFFRASVFEDHWVTFGYRPRLDVFYSGRIVLTPTQETEGRSLVRFAKRDSLLTSGFCWPTSLDLIAETPYVVYRSEGSGHVVAFTDDPNFRAMYPSLQRLFMNAVLFGAGH